MQSNKCQLRSGSPVPEIVKPKCEKLPPPSGGCPPGASERCGQYELEHTAPGLCKPFLPPFYETDKQRPGKKAGKDCCPCCLQELPSPKQEVQADCCDPKSPPKNGAVVCNGFQQPNGRHDKCLQMYQPVSKCNPKPDHHRVCPPYGTDLPCAPDLDKQCIDACKLPTPPPCWGTPNHKQNGKCPAPLSTPPCGPESSPDNRSALRPDIRDCPALGRNFCINEPAQPRCHNTPAVTTDCSQGLTGVLVNAAAFTSEVKATGEQKPYCVPNDYNDKYCGASATNFPMYCATSSGVQTLPGLPELQLPGMDKERCPANDPCCGGAGLAPVFLVDPDSCCGRPCVFAQRPDRDVGRRVGGFKQNMPPPTSWV